MIIPLIVLIIILYGYFKKVDVYDTFIEGVKESFKMILNLFPTFIAMILAVNLFINSGVLDYVLSFINPALKAINISGEILPLAIVRPISGSASLAYLNSIFSKYGPDSLIGLLGSVIQGCTDTTFYIISLYFGSIGIKKIRHSMVASLFADLVGIIASIIVVNLFWG